MSCDRSPKISSDESDAIETHLVVARLANSFHRLFIVSGEGISRNLYEHDQTSFIVCEFDHFSLGVPLAVFPEFPAINVFFERWGQSDILVYGITIIGFDSLYLIFANRYKH